MRWHFGAGVVPTLPIIQDTFLPPRISIRKMTILICIWMILCGTVIQLDSADEQAAAIRRELDGRRQKVSDMERNRKLMPRFVLKEMESLYIEECRSAINMLMANLESLPVSKSSTDSKYGLPKLKKMNHR
jgi:hypothetical protein